ncbi:MAG: SRPBCC family protein [Bacteroidota bacterium]
MKYTCTIEIPLHRKECVKMWMDEAKFPEWQEGFKHRKWLQGEPNNTHSKSEILFVQGKRTLELEERILDNSLPDYILGEYVHKHMTNTQKTTFEMVSPSITLIRSDVEYTAFRGFMPKLLARLFPGMFKNQSQKWLDNFGRMVKSTISK